MKGFFSVLALPALIIPALAAPSPAQVALQKKDLAIMQTLYSAIEGPETAFQTTMKSLTAAPTKQQTKQLEAEMKQVMAALETAKSQIEAANAASGLTARSAEAATPGAQLLAELDKVVTEIGMGVASGIASGDSLPDEVGNLMDQALGALSALGGPISEAIPQGADEISALLEKILGGSS